METYRPECCHGVAELVHDSTEQQRREEVDQLAGGQVDSGDLKDTGQEKKVKPDPDGNGGSAP